MNDIQPFIEKRFRLSPVQAERLHQFAATHRTSEDAIVKRALEILFSLTDLLDEGAEGRGWSYLSGDALARVWDNDEDARYDDWRQLYGVSAG